MYWISNIFGQNGSSTVDYLLLGLLYLPYINNFEILPPNEFSDHCPISFSINIKTNKSENLHESENQTYIKYDPSLADSFKQEIITHIHEINNLTTHMNDTQTNETVNQFTTIMQTCINKTFLKSSPQKKTFSDKNQRTYNPWYKDECDR